MFLRRFFIIITFGTFLFIFNNHAFANETCCSENGGIYACNYETNQLYCKDGTISKTCACRKASPTPSPTPIPTPEPTLPFCVPNSTWNKSLNACKCDSGFIVKDKSCVTYNNFCLQSFGSNTTYDNKSKSCTCTSGYSWDENLKKCITFNQICKNKLGDKSYYNSDENSCYCFQNYYIDDGKCELIPSPSLSPKKENKEIITPAPLPFETAYVEDVSSSSDSAQIEESETKVDDIKSEYEGFEIVEKEDKGILTKIIENIWNFFANLF